MKKLITISLIFLSAQVFSQSGLDNLEESFRTQDSLYSMLLKVNGTLDHINQQHDIISMNIGNDTLSDYKSVEYTFKDKVLISYVVTFKDDRQPDLSMFIDLYGKYTKFENQIYSWYSDVRNVCVEYAANSSQLIIKTK